MSTVTKPPAENKHYPYKYKPNLSVSTEKNIKDVIYGVENNEKQLYEQALINFLTKEIGNFDIEELKGEGIRQKFWNALLKVASSTEDNHVLAVVFSIFRIVSRDKASVNTLVTEEWLNLMTTHTGLNDTTFNYDDDTLSKIEEGQKALWNIFFNSKEQVEASIKNGLLTKILNRIKFYQKTRVRDEIKFFDIKTIFLISALSPAVRSKVEKLNGLNIFMVVLKVVLKEAAESISQESQLPAVLDDKKADVVCETLKAMFNITLDCEDLDQCRDLVAILRDYLLASTVSLDKTWQLRSDLVNLLANMPAAAYSELMTLVDDSSVLPKSLRFEGNNMIIIHEILMFLEAKFNDDTVIVGKQLVVYSPVLTVLLKGAAAHRAIRKFLRAHILPPLKEMDMRPEETNTLRGHLCKLLTTPITQVRDLVAELLFVLCKCNVSRMIKYTGFGNAAGLLAQRGLLGGKKDAAEAQYSSDSEDSETEEYAEQKHLINPVLGCVEQPHAHAMEGMTDEQKEYEAIKLVQLMDNLLKSGTIQPCRVGEDGKPHPIEHVLQLQEGLKMQQPQNDSDSD